MSHPTSASSSQSSLQPHTLQPSKLSPCFCIISRLILALILLYAVVSIVCYVAWLILDPQPPLFTLNSLSVSNATLISKSQEKNASYCLELSIKNPNKKISLQMDDFRIFLLYNATDVSDSETYMNTYTVDLEKMGERTVTAKGEMVVNEWSRSGPSIMDIVVKMKVMMRLRAANLLTRQRIIEVLCKNLGVDFIKGRGKNCSVVLYKYG